MKFSNDKRHTKPLMLCTLVRKLKNLTKRNRTKCLLVHFMIARNTIYFVNKAHIRFRCTRKRCCKVMKHHFTLLTNRIWNRMKLWSISLFLSHSVLNKLPKLRFTKRNRASNKISLKLKFLDNLSRKSP